MKQRRWRKWLAFTIAVCMVGLGCSPLAAGRINLDKLRAFLNRSTTSDLERFSFDGNEKPMRGCDEGDHFPCGVEWWWLYLILTLEDGRVWDMCIQFLYQMNLSDNEWSETDGFSYVRIQSWDRETGNYYDCLHVAEHPGPFTHSKDMVDLKYYGSTMMGLYPFYEAYLDDDINDISLSINFTAQSVPHFFGTEPVDGVIPWGTGSFQYWSMPQGDAEGRIFIDDESYAVTGIGYTEHMFADTHLFSDLFRPKSLGELIDIGNLYVNLGIWGLLENVKNGIIRVDTLHTSTDNLIGYDWIWIGFNNGWSAILYRFTAFMVDDGQSLAILVVTDGEQYWEFGDVYTCVRKETYLGERDIYLPLDFEIIGRKDGNEIFITFNSTTEITKMFIDKGNYELGNFLVAGDSYGYFKDSQGNTISLEGKGTNTPLRFIPRYLRHISSDIELILPPYGLGIVRKKITHYLGVEIYVKFQIRPFFEIDFHVKRSPHSFLRNLVEYLKNLKTS